MFVSKQYGILETDKYLLNPASKKYVYTLSQQLNGVWKTLTSTASKAANNPSHTFSARIEATTGLFVYRCTSVLEDTTGTQNSDPIKISVTGEMVIISDEL